MDIRNGIVKLWDLPSDKTYMGLNKKVKQKLFAIALKYAGSWANLAKVLNLSINRYGRCKILESSYYKKISLRMLKLLLHYTKQNGSDLTEEVEGGVLVLASPRGSSRKGANCLFNPKLPFNFNTESGAIVISALLHDGGIDSKLHPHYCNPLDVPARKKVYLAFKNVFGDFDFLRSEPEKNSQLYFPHIVGVILIYGLGLQYGRKVTNNPGIPGFLFNSSEKIRAAFLRQAFDDEAYVHNTKRYISLKLAVAGEKPPKLLVDLQRLLSSFDVKSHGPRFCEKYVDKKGILATKWAIELHHQDNLVKFLNKVDFESPYKHSRLKRIVETLKQKHFAIKEKPQLLLDACRKVQSNLGYVTSANLATALDRSQVLAKVEIRKLRAEGKLSIIKPRIGSSAARYMLVETW